MTSGKEEDFLSAKDFLSPQGDVNLEPSFSSELNRLGLQAIAVLSKELAKDTSQDAVDMDLVEASLGILEVVKGALP